MKRFQSTFALFSLLTFCGLLSGQVQGHPAGAKEIQLSLTQSGVNQVSSEIVKRFLKDERVINLPNVETRVDYGIDVTLEGMSAAIKVDDVHLTNSEGYLDFLLKIKDAQVRIAKIRAKRGTIFGDITITCDDVTLNLGAAGGTQIGAEMLPQVEGGRVQVQARNVRYDLSDDNFQVDGPRSCSGGPLEGFIKGIVNNAIKKSREKVQEQVRGLVPKAAGSLSEELDKLTRQNLDFALELPPYLPHLQIAGHINPQDLEVSQGELSFAFSWQFMQLFNDLAGKAYLSPGQDWEKFGTIKIRETFLNNVAAQVLDKNRQLFAQRLDEELLPKLTDILRQDFLAPIIPDLGKIKLDGPELRGHFFLQGNANLELKEDTGSILLKAPPLVLGLWVSQDGVWRPYFNLIFEVKLGLKVQIEQSRLELQYDSLESLDVRGEWDANYQPQDTSFAKEDLLTVLEDLKGSLDLKRPKFSINLPNFSIGDRPCSIDGAVIQGQSINVNVLVR